MDWIGATLVVSPLIALMEDQVQSLRDKHVRAVALHSGMSWDAILAARDARPGGRFEHLSDLLALEGDGAPGPSRVLGPLDEIAILSRVDGDEEDLGDDECARRRRRRALRAARRAPRAP